jgi:hypothetical protein
VDDSTHRAQPRPSLSPRLVTLLIVAVYAVVMVSTNTRFTILDDESKIIAVSGHPIIPALRQFLAGEAGHEMHPPATDVLLHLWLVATHFSFFALRIFANLFFIAGAWVVAKSAGKIAGPAAYFAALILAFVWPFAFQYGRITGWYCYSFFLVAWVTWAYLQLLDDRGLRAWLIFAVASLLLVWSNYFGVAILLLLMADLLLFQRMLALSRLLPLLAVVALVALALLPIVSIAVRDMAEFAAPAADRFDFKSEFVTAAFPAFSIFASAAVAPWYLPLSIPIACAVLALLLALWFSPGRRWLVYFLLAMVTLDLSGGMSIKRVLFLLPWLFLSMSVAAASSASRLPRVAVGALAVIVACGWIGIASGGHYATTNLYEPWGEVAAVVAQDARRGATIVSENPPFFLYLDYQLGLEADTSDTVDAYLGQAEYRTHGYRILQPALTQLDAAAFSGRVVVVNGAGFVGDVQDLTAFNDALRARCQTLGTYRAAPDPAAAFKQRFTKDVPVLAYRTQVFWYDCP